MKTSELIDQLTENVGPVRVVPNLSRRFLSWMAVGGLMALGGILIMGVRSDFSEVTRQVFYYLESFALLVLMLGGALWGLRLSIPGQEPSSKIVWLPILGGLIWVAMVVARLAVVQSDAEGIHFNLDSHFPCAVSVLGLGFIPNIVLSRMAAQAYPLRKNLTGLLIGSASGALGALAMQIICGQNHPPHLLVWHGAPILASALVGWFFSQKLYPSNA